MVMNDGTVYEGDWYLGEMQGMGQLKLSDGSVYIGEFSRGIFNGKVRKNKVVNIYRGN